MQLVLDMFRLYSHFLFQIAECEDKKSEKYCNKQKNGGKCDKKKVYDKCPMTCDMCGLIPPPCKDKRSEKYCRKQKRKKKCKTKKVKKNCQLTCGECGKAYKTFTVCFTIFANILMSLISV